MRSSRVIYPIASFLIIPVVCSSLLAHIRSRNVAVISLIFWLAVLGLIRGVNAIVWDGNVQVRLLVWCDITSKIAIGWTLAVPLTMLCLVKHLEHVASNRQAIITEHDKRRRMIFEGVMCYIVPMVFMALHYCVQGHRLDIYENFGCYANTYASVPAFILIFLPPFLVSVVSMGYTVAAIFHLYHNRRNLTSVIQSSGSEVSQSHYYRLLALGIVECLWDTGLNSWVLSLAVKAGFRPWISWENVHSNFSFVQPLPWSILPEDLIRLVVVEWWIPPLTSLGYFCFFAFGEEAKADYVATWRFIKTKIFRIRVVESQSQDALPMYIDSPLSVTKLANEKEGIITDAPWEKIKLNIGFTETSSASNYSPSLPTASSSSSLVEKEKKVTLSPVTGPAPIYDSQQPSMPLPTIVTHTPSRNVTPELRVMGPFEADSRNPSIDSESARRDTSSEGHGSSSNV